MSFELCSVYVVVVAGRNANVNSNSGSKSGKSNPSNSGAKNSSGNAIGYQYPSRQFKVYIYLCWLFLSFGGDQQVMTFFFLIGLSHFQFKVCVYRKRIKPKYCFSLDGIVV